MYCLEELSPDDLAHVVLHENTTAAASGLTEMQAPVLDLVEFSWGSLPWEGSSAQLASVSDLHQFSPSTSFFAGILKLVACNFVLLRYTLHPKKPPAQSQIAQAWMSSSSLRTSVLSSALVSLHSLLLCAGINRKIRPCVCSFAL